MKIRGGYFYEFEINEEIDFTKEIYGVYPKLSDNFSIVYVDNPVINPNYTNYISYKTTSSNYKMKLRISGIPRREISEYNRQLILNNLLFVGGVIYE